MTTFIHNAYQEEEGENEEQSEDEISQQELDKMKDNQVNQQMKSILSKLTDEQSQRYEYFRRSSFPRAAIKRIMQSISGASIGLRTIIVMAGISKIFVGELVEESRTVMTEWNQEGPIMPEHLREAYRRLRLKNKVSYDIPKKRLFSK
eukprot:TRINITY_DN10142_c0_g1_i1.p1 TRINITY_DN10142_c0_g1~~TRINITY_DN10142_c0_g1_i1.p1  ORF type:complete len:169 (+),score=38.60 TRINITY_DN10142_c0_g1_i1:65-508(+)